MTINVGTPDRIVRVILGLVLAVVPFVTGWPLFESPLWTWTSVIIGLVLIVTGVIRFCPIYRIANLSTAKRTRQ